MADYSNRPNTDSPEDKTLDDLAVDAKTTQMPPEKPKGISVLHGNQPFLWMLILFLVTIVAVVAYYLYTVFSPAPLQVMTKVASTPEETPLAAQEDISEEPPVITEPVISEPTVVNTSSLTKAMSSGAQEYTLAELRDLANIKTSVPWPKVFTAAQDYSIYLIYDIDAKEWLIAADSQNLEVILKYVKNFSKPKYFLVLGEYPLTDRYKMGQLVNRITMQGYNAYYTKTKNSTYNIKVGVFNSHHSAMETGEKIHDFFKNAEIFSAGFSTEKLDYRSNLFMASGDFFVLHFETFNSLEQAYDLFSDIKQSFADEASKVVYLQKESEAYTIVVGFFKNRRTLDKTLQEKGTSIPASTVMTASRVNF